MTISSRASPASKVPATGFSIGVSRLYSALKLVGKAQDVGNVLAPVVVLVMDKAAPGRLLAHGAELRKAGIRAEMYMGTAGMKAQMKYADKRGAPLVIIQGGDEKARGEVQIKDLRLGSELSRGIESREEYASQRLAQFSVPEADLVAAVKKAPGPSPMLRTGEGGSMFMPSPAAGGRRCPKGG
jgi:histidyl-tRNA synthetase